jgi:hypothetical protein
MGSRENSLVMREKINNPYRSFMCSSHQMPEANLKIQMRYAGTAKFKVNLKPEKISISFHIFEIFMSDR